MCENLHFKKVLHAVTFIKFLSIFQNLLQLYLLHALTIITYTLFS